MFPFCFHRSVLSPHGQFPCPRRNQKLVVPQRTPFRWCVSIRNEQVSGILCPRHHFRAPFGSWVRFVEHCHEIPQERPEVKFEKVRWKELFQWGVIIGNVQGGGDSILMSIPGSFHHQVFWYFFAFGYLLMKYDSTWLYFGHFCV